MLLITTWLWGTKYSATDVHKLAAGLRRHLRLPYKFLCVTDDARELRVECASIRDPELTKIPGCFARLRLFDAEAQAAHDLGPDDRIVCMDLDSVITGSLDPVFNRAEDFVILQGANASNPCPYNGSVWMLRPGYRPDVWTDFSVEASKKIPFDRFPDDQGWLAVKIPGAAGWQAGVGGVYAFQKPGWPKGTSLPRDARLVVFPGWREPAKFQSLDWIQKHWVE